MKHAWIGGIAMAAMAVTGCKRIDDPGSGASTTLAGPNLVKRSFAFQPCPTATPDTIGTITIIVPRNFNDNKINRSVTMKRAKNFDPANPDITVDPRDVNTPGVATIARKIQPFDAYIDGTATNAVFKPGDTGLVMVRVVIPNGSDWEFYSSDEGFHGVGLAKERFAGMTCGGTEARLSPSALEARAKQAAIFYFDIGQFDWRDGKFAIPFNIAIVLDEYDETPIIIDPKIRNDGSCCITPK